MSYLKVFIESTEFTYEAENFLNETISHTLLDSQFIYLGYKKPINAFYAGLDTANTNSATLNVEYYNGTGWASVTELKDETRAFKRSGFVRWDRNQENETKTTVNSLELFWIRVSTSVTTSALVFSGINMLLSDDLMLKEIDPSLLSSDYYPDGESSFIGFHQAAKSHIIQRLRNEGKGTYSVEGDEFVKFNDLNIFDLLDYRQLSEASKYLCAAKIYFDRSDSLDDKYYQKFQDYTNMFNQAYRVYFLSLDTNDDGKQSEAERKNFQSRVINRV